MVAEFSESDGGRTDRAPHDAYLEREIDRTVAAVSDEYERFRFHQVVNELQSFARLLRRYRSHDEPYRFAYSRGLRTLAKLIAPLAPYLAEELWIKLDGDGLMAQADWPAPLQDVGDYALERDLVRTTLADVRDITDVVDITDPDRIELVVAQAWKYDAYGIARDADPGEAIVGAIMEANSIQRHGDAAVEYAATLAEGQAGLEPVLGAERERRIVEEAAWLFEEEFGATVEVRRAEDGDDLAPKARPNKPAIHVS